MIAIIIKENNNNKINQGLDFFFFNNIQLNNKRKSLKNK